MKLLTVTGPSVDDKTISYQTEGAACFDIMSTEDGIVESGSFKVFKTGLIAGVIEDGYEIKGDVLPELQIRSRSGLAAKHGLFVLNAPGVIDIDYFGNEIKVILANAGPVDYAIKAGDRIAQGAFSFVVRPSNINVKQVERTSGLGSTGK